MEQITNQNDISKQIIDDTHRWYSLSVVSWQEHIVVENMKERIKKQNLSEDIVDFLVPEVNDVVMKAGKKISKPRKLYPWYVFVKTRMNEKLWYIIRNTPWVKLIVGAETRPIPLTEQEYQMIMNNVNQSNEKATMFVPFQVGDVVAIKDWNFANMKWNVKDVDVEKWLVVVNVEILWRLTPVVLTFDKVAQTN
jgi:transcription termination/antitermination protein NusG